MADSILRLRVQSEEYDNKLKRASEAIQRYADGCRKAGGTLTQLDDGVLEFTKALGQMETVSNSARGKIGEMTKAFTELSVQYNKLTEEEKQSPFGKALSESLNTLKGRIQEGKTELDDINKSLNGGGGLKDALDQVAGKFGLNIDMVTKFGGVVGVTATALKVAKDAFFASEANVDEWGRTMDASKSLYEGFLTALNTGDISGYLSNIDQIVTAARQAYNELDRLGTMKTIQGPQMSAQQTENERMRMMIQTGRYIAPVDGRRATMQSGQLLTPEQIRRIEQQLQNGMKTVVGLVGNEVKQTGKAIDAVYNRQAQELGMSLKEFRKGTSSMAEFDKRMEGFSNYQKWRNENYYTDNWGNRRVKEGNPYQDYAKWGTFRVDGDRYNDLVRLIQQRDQQASQAYGTMSQAYRAINRAEGITVKGIMNGGGSGGGGGKGGNTSTIAEIIPEGSVKALTQQMQELKKAQDLVTTPDAWREYQTQIDEIAIKIGQMTGKIGSLKPGDIQTTGLGSLMANPFADDSKKTDGLKLTLDDKAIKAVMDGVQKSLPKQKDLLGDSKKLVGGLSNIASGFQQMGVELPDEVNQIIGVVQGLMTVIEGVNTIIGMTQTPALVANTIAMDALTTALWTTGFFGFANGGVVPHAASGFMVPGTHYSGDVTPIMANAGEVVLNRAQAGVIANQLEAGGQHGGYTPSHVSGEQIWIALNAYTRRTGKGELVTWR